MHALGGTPIRSTDTASRWSREGDLFLAATAIAKPGIWIGAALVALYAIWFYGMSGMYRFGLDAHAYWLAGRLENPYNAGPGEIDAFLYSPVFALVMRIMAVMPWPMFLTIWMVADAAAIWWLGTAARIGDI